MLENETDGPPEERGLLDKYDAIGFGMSTCLVKYKPKRLRRLVCEAYLNDLMDHFEYPPCVIDFNYEKMLKREQIFYSVWDVTNGTII